jgi:hypothetical protein
LLSPFSEKWTKFDQFLLGEKQQKKRKHEEPATLLRYTSESKKRKRSSVEVAESVPSPSPSPGSVQVASNATIFAANESNAFDALKVTKDLQTEANAALTKRLPLWNVFVLVFLCVGCMSFA